MLQSTLTAPLPRSEAGVPKPIVDEPPTTVREASRPLRPRDAVGRYVIERQLGSGGMGVVYGARDRALGRTVALKLVRRRLRPSPYDSQFSERLRREARALASLSHPNVVALYDLGTAKDAVFLAMEFIQGEHLARTLARDRPGWRRTLSLFEQAGQGLAAAHRAGIVHRDFKPTNVIVGPDEHVTVVDFGLACGASLEHDEEPDDDGEGKDTTPRAPKKLTDTNVIIGTRGYMAPEQLLGLPVGPAADQFAFCISLFEALYGTRPYPGNNAVETARSFAARQLCTPSDRRGVPAALHRALLKGLSIEPTERFDSMEALMAALRPPPARRRHYGMATVVLATAAASALATAWLGGRLGPQTAVASAGIVCEPAPRSAPSDVP